MPPTDSQRAKSPASSTELRALAVLAGGALCISFAAIFVKWLNRQGMGPTAIAFWRTALGAIILFLWTWVRRNRTLLPWQIMRWTLVAGFLFFLDLFFWHRSVILAGAGMSTILANTQVFATAVLSFLVFKERLTGRFFVAAASGIIGVVLLVGVGSNIVFTVAYLRGIAYGLATGVVYANYLISLKKAGHEPKSTSPVTLMAWTSVYSSLLLGVVALLTESNALLPPDAASWVGVFGLALVAQAAGWIMISRSLPKLDASRSGLVLLLQPVLTTVWGFLLFQEAFTVMQVVGATITLAAIYVGSVRRAVSEAIVPTAGST